MVWCVALLSRHQSPRLPREVLARIAVKRRHCEGKALGSSNGNHRLWGMPRPGSGFGIVVLVCFERRRPSSVSSLSGVKARQGEKDLEAGGAYRPAGDPGARRSRICCNPQVGQAYAVLGKAGRLAGPVDAGSWLGSTSRWHKARSQLEVT
ncbi:hypothetical protein BD289DRAFT_109458 [Coniella lustricola]|uniref:Uncharacterized protein n=1 Tax=Coniella lustricola TaxID=2025994 RepID=A0A2T2ZXH2_9PEZI|nr:hypothetical protein BD289DRAFT_109458 [Coniella lustricola]